MSNNINLQEQVQHLLRLRREMEDFVKEVKASGKPLDNDIISRIGELSSQAVKLEFSLIDVVARIGVIDGLTDPHARAVVMELIEKSRERIDSELEDDPLEMDPDDEDQAWDDVYNLIGTPKELLLNRRRADKIVALASIPQRIHELLEEAQTCFITQQRNATLALGRMMLEFAIMDIGIKLRCFPEPGSVDRFFKNYPPYEQAKVVLGAGGSRMAAFDRLYCQASRVIHSSHDRSTEGVAVFLEEIIQLIGDTYTANHRQLQSAKV